MINIKQRNFVLVIAVAFLVSFLTNNEIEYIVHNTIVTVVAVYNNILNNMISFFKKEGIYRGNVLGHYNPWNPCNFISNIYLNIGCKISYHLIVIIKTY